MLAFIGDYFLYIVLGSMAFFALTLGGASIVEAISPPEPPHR